MDEACYALAIAVGGFFMYSRFREVQCERFENKINTRKYTLKELCELLQIVKNTLQKDGDVYHLIDVRKVEFTLTGATVVLTAFNKSKWTTKLYKAYAHRGGTTAEITENMVSFDESYVENKAFGKKMGMHDSEALGSVPFMNSDVASLSRYTFTREALASTEGKPLDVVGAFDSIPIDVKTADGPLPGTERSKRDFAIAAVSTRSHLKLPERERKKDIMATYAVIHNNKNQKSRQQPPITGYVPPSSQQPPQQPPQPPQPSPQPPITGYVPPSSQQPSQQPPQRPPITGYVPPSSQQPPITGVVPSDQSQLLPPFKPGESSIPDTKRGMVRGKLPGRF